jgi:hypothetical protein
MIVFYDNQTGEVVGTIEGRIHPEIHLEMFMGDRDRTSRIVCNWKPVEGTNDFEPEIQKEVFTKLDKDPSSVYNYKVDLKTQTLVNK